jgi:hypothetical protein
VKAELEASLAARLGPRDLAQLRRLLALVEF